MIRIKWNNNCIGWEIGNYNLNNLNWKRRNLIYWKLHRINQSTTLLLLLHIIIVIRIPILYFVRRRFPKDFCYNEVPYMNTSEGGLTYRRVWVGDLQLVKILSHTNREIIKRLKRERKNACYDQIAYWLSQHWLLRLISIGLRQMPATEEYLLFIKFIKFGNPEQQLNERNWPHTMQRFRNLINLLINSYPVIMWRTIK